MRGNSPVTGEFPSQSPLTRSFDVFFDMCLNKRLSKQSRRRWFRTHYYVTVTQYPRLCTRQVTMRWRRKYVFMIVLSGNEPKYISGKFNFYNTYDLPLKLRDIQVAYLLMFITLLLAHILKIQHCIPKQVDKWFYVFKSNAYPHNLSVFLKVQRWVQSKHFIYTPGLCHISLWSAEHVARMYLWYIWYCQIWQ